MSAQSPPPPPLQNPIAGSTIDTSPRQLGLENGEPESLSQVLTGSKEESPRRRSLVKRQVEKLSGSMFSSRSPSSGGQESSRKRLFSLNKKGSRKETRKSDEITSGDDESPGAKAALSSSVPNTDDSPFIRPSSPADAGSARPSIQPFRVFDSMRAGTQPLIHAIQALPWTEEPDLDDEISESPANSSEEGQDDRLIASSIHTIHRPIARSRRQESLLLSAGPKKFIPPVASSDEEDSGGSDNDDFEQGPQNSRISHLKVKGKGETTKTPPPSRNATLRSSMTRTASLATVRLQRRAKLAEKLKAVFGLQAVEEVVAELPCWLLRSVLLQGYMYLTNSHMCFFAHMPIREDEVLKSGSLSKKTQRTKRWIKHWFVLKNDVLSWYQSSSDPYFPHGVVDLRYTISCEPVGEKGFRIRTNEKVVSLTADSVPSREEWVKAIRKVMFKAQNLGDSVKISIPYSAILDVEKSSAMDFSETIEVKVVDNTDQMLVDSYFFAYFQNISLALDQIRDAVRTYKPAVTPSSAAIPEVVLDTTAQRAPHDRLSPEPQSKGYTSRIASLFGFSSSEPHGEIRPSDSSSTLKAVPRPQSPKQDVNPIRHVPSDSSSTSASTSITSSDSHATPKMTGSHTYPPFPSISDLHHVSSRDSASSSSTWYVPTWLKSPSRRVFTSPISYFITDHSPSDRNVSEVLSPVRPSLSSLGSHSADLGFSVLEAKEAAEPEIVDKFRNAFAFDEKEVLLGYFTGSLLRLLPTHGRLYISTHFFCFKSSGPLATKTRMILPMRDILSTEITRAYRFGHYGLVIIIKGHEELFFEFGTSDRRTAFINLLEKQIEENRRQLASGSITITKDQKEALILEELEPSTIMPEDEPKPLADTLSDSLPAVMFTSQSSTFLTFKPQQSLHFTCLTIGSRGDVQPYIALAKGLMADGHRVKIATHGEFKEWIESHGIEYGYVGGDPAELMRICVENGTFTVSFFKEGIMKFRGWIDDLLKTSWEACQGTDVLIESPSAMGGIHIAEALKIPYFRAFTMTWTRTRAYPHAFAVPERKMGGAYNYMTYVMFDQVFWRGTAGQINRWRKNVLGLPSTSLDRLEPHKVPFLYNFSPTIVPPPLDWPEWIRVTGYWFLDDADVGATRWTPPEGLLKFIDTAHSAGKKVVYIGFGSIVVSDPVAMTRCVVEAIERSGVYAILSKGWSDRLQAKKPDPTVPEIPLPSTIYPISSIPHDWLFKRIDAACHHGGAGTTGASLRAGIPTIIKPFFGDQFFWGDRVEALGIGSSVRKLTVESLAEALTFATTDQKQIDRAKLVGEQIRSENGVATAIEAIYRDLEYARTLIKARIEDHSDESSSEQEEKARSSPKSSPDRKHASSRDSNQGAPSDDWSVISDPDDKRQVEAIERSPLSKRSSLAAAVLSVLPDALSTSRNNARTVS